MSKIIIDCKIYDDKKVEFPNDSFYEVIAVSGGAMVFAKEHLERLNSSLKNANVNFKVTDEDFYSNCNKLFSEEGILDSNIRYVVYKNSSKYKQGVQYYDVKLPSKDEKTMGCDVKLVEFERNAPHIKRVDDNFQKIREKLANDNVYEYIFANKKGEILEGTRTNVYFVIGENLYTAPIKGVLKGITRIYVNQIANELGILDEIALNLSDLDCVEAAFLTGTLVGVLPIKAINGRCIDSKNNNIVTKIMSEYDKILSYDIKNNQIK